MVLLQRLVRRFVAELSRLHIFLSALPQRRSFLLVRRCDGPVRYVAVLPRGLPGLQWEHPVFRSLPAHIRNHVGHMCHICIWAVVYLSVDIGSEESVCPTLVLVFWTLFCPVLFADGFSSAVSPSPLVGGGWW